MHSSLFGAAFFEAEGSALLHSGAEMSAYSHATDSYISITGRIMKLREVVCFPYFQISGVSKLRLKQIQLRVEVVSFSEIKCRSCVFGGPKLL